jgi:mRNA interferase RelE/StbE
LGTSWIVEFKEETSRELLLLPKDVSPRIARKIDFLHVNPAPVGSKKLAGFPDLYRLRVGDYRVVYHVRRREHAVYILRVRHRRDAYRGL